MMKVKMEVKKRMKEIAWRVKEKVKKRVSQVI
jgi:hypothetical protein